MHRTLVVFLSLLLLLSLFSLTAQANSSEYSKARLLSELSSISPGSSFWTMVHLRTKADWHAYWKNPGDSGLAMTLDWQLPQGFKAGDIVWQAPEKIAFDTLMNFGYNNEAFYLVKIQAPEKINAKNIDLKLNARWLVCKEICVPEEAELNLKLKVTQKAKASADAALIKEKLGTVNAIKMAQGKVNNISDNSFSLMVNISEVENINRGIRDAFFFPELGGLIKNTAKQSFSTTGETIKLNIERDPIGSKSQLRKIEGILAITLKDGSKRHLEMLHGSRASVNQDQGEKSSALNILLAILFAFLGGILLNAMPCVFPVLSLKILALTSKKKSKKKEAFWKSDSGAQAIAYTSGIVLSFVILALALIALKASGAAIGWGYQMQSPVFVTILIYLFYIIGLNLIGVFEFSMPVSIGNTLHVKDDISGSFMTGVLATAVATPCSAPFMATAIGFALAQSTIVALLIFASLGFGLAFPYLLVSWLPSSLSWLPKPGHWMETFKEFLAFPIFLTVIWLIWVLVQQIHDNDVAILLSGLLGISFSIWLWQKLNVVKKRHKTLLALILIAFASGPLYMISQAQKTLINGSHPVGHESFTQAKLDQLLSEDKAVFVDATAAWCITCKANEKLVLSRRKIQDFFKDKDIIFMKADWTNQNPEITAWLNRFNRSGVPLYVYYPANGKEPVVLPQILTEDIVINSIK